MTTPPPARPERLLRVARHLAGRGHPQPPPWLAGAAAARHVVEAVAAATARADRPQVAPCVAPP